MPNHVDSQLKVIGPEEDIARFKEAAERGDTPLSLSNLYPMPAELVGTKSPAVIVSEEEYAAYKQREADGKLEPGESMGGRPITQKESDELIKKYEFNNWYDWAHVNWGTKWGVYHTEFKEDSSSETELMYSFQTAWSPATPAWIKISADWPTLVFQTICEDEGGGFLTREDFEDGEQTRDDTINDVRSSTWYEFAEAIASSKDIMADFGGLREDIEEEYGELREDLDEMIQRRLQGETVEVPADPRETFDFDYKEEE